MEISYENNGKVYTFRITTKRFGPFKSQRAYQMAVKRASRYISKLSDKATLQAKRDV